MRNRFSYLCNHHFPSYTLSVFHSEVVFFSTIIFHRFHCCLCSCPARMINGLWTLTRLPLAILLHCRKLSASISGQQQKKFAADGKLFGFEGEKMSNLCVISGQVKGLHSNSLSLSAARCRLSEIFFSVEVKIEPWIIINESHRLNDQVFLSSWRSFRVPLLSVCMCLHKCDSPKS